MIKYVIAGFLVKIITGFDDTITRVPVIESIAPTRMGKIVFSVGTILAVALAAVVAVFFAELLKHTSFGKYISAALLIVLGILIWADVFVTAPKKRTCESLGTCKPISAKRFLTLLGIGFIASVATVIDDVIAFSSIFIAPIATIPFTIAGILIATVLEILLVILFAEKIAKIPYKEEIAALGLFMLAGATVTGLI